MKYVLVNWCYNQTGRWLSISSTDFETARQVSTLCMDHVRAYRRVRYDKFSKEGGLAMIEGIETDADNGDIDRFLSDFFVREGWKPDRRASHSFSKTS